MDSFAGHLVQMEGDLRQELRRLEHELRHDLPLAKALRPTGRANNVLARHDAACVRLAELRQELEDLEPVLRHLDATGEADLSDPQTKLFWAAFLEGEPRLQDWATIEA